MMLSVNIENVKYQALSITLSGQNCIIELTQMDTGLFFSLYINKKPIALNVLCLNDVKLVRYKYLGFTGDLFFHDTQGNDNPDYSGLGERFLLYYGDIL